MSTIAVTQPHSLTKDEAKARAEELAKNLASKLGLDWKWVDDAIEFEASSGMAKGVSGEVRVNDREIMVSVNLPGMLKLMKKTVEEKVKEKLIQLL